MKYPIKISNFEKHYQNEQVKIKDLLITNRITILQGKNGSGKSTLLKAVGGFITYDGNISTKGKIVYMSESTSFPNDLKLVDFIDTLNRVSQSKKSKEEIEYLFKIFNLSTKKESKLSSLSKGMKAKVNLLQVLLEKADIYLLDEPINGLDKEGVTCLINYLKKSDKSFIISSHLIEDFSDLKSELIHL